MPDYVDVTDVKRLRSANGFDPLAPKDYQEAVGDMSYFGAIVRPERVLPPRSHVLDLLRVSLVLEHPRSSPVPITPGSSLGTGHPVAGTPLLRYEYTPRLPEAFLVGAAERRPRDQALAALDGRAPLDPTSVALVDSACAPCRRAGEPGPAGVVGATRWRLEGFDAEVAATRPAMLVVSQAWFPGWRASVDGHPAPVVRVDGVVQGVPVGAGRHLVALRYRPPGLLTGALVSAASLVGLTLWAALHRRRRA